MSTNRPSFSASNQYGVRVTNERVAVRLVQVTHYTELYFTTKCDNKKNRIETGLN